MDSPVGRNLELEEHLWKLLEPNYERREALLMLSSPCFSLSDDTSEDKPTLIFLVYMRFIVTRVNRFAIDNVSGIWEKILKKILVYTRNLSSSGKQITHIRRTYNRIVPTYCWGSSDDYVQSWLQRALADTWRCPNPYMRLELFRLLRIFSFITKPEWKHISVTFVHTIREIQPHHLYPKNYMDEVFYDIHDLSMNLANFLNNIPFFITNVKFLTHCIQLIGVFTRLISSNPDHKKQMREIRICCSTFMVHILEQFLHSIPYKKLRPYLVETICELTEAMINNNQRSRKKIGSIGNRDDFVKYLRIPTKPCDLPRLLLARQVQGPKAVHRHCLLLDNLVELYKNIPFDDGDFEESDDEDSDVNDTNIEDSDIEDSDTDDSYVDDINMISMI